MPQSNFILRLCRGISPARVAIGLTFGTLTLGGLLQPSSVMAAGTLSSEIAEKDAKVSVVKSGLGLCDSPTVDANGNLVFLDRTKGDLWQVSTKGELKKLALSLPGARSIAIEKDGTILVTKPKQLSKVDKDGKESLLIAGDLMGEPEDMSVGSSGALFFTNGAGKAIFYRTPDGKRIAHRGAAAVISGLAYRDEKQTLYLSYLEEDRVVSYDITVEGFLGQTPKEVAKVARPGGITIDEQGNIFVVSQKEKAIYAFSAEGKDLGHFEISNDKVKAPALPTNLLFAGPDKKTLFVTGEGGLWKLAMKNPGLAR